MKKYLFIALTIFFLGMVSFSWADITSVTVTPAATDNLSNGKGYYLAGNSYTFTIKAVDPEIINVNDWTSVELEFCTGGATKRSVKINLDDGTVLSTTGLLNGSLVSHTAVASNLDCDVTVTFAWNADEYNAILTNSLKATVIEDHSGQSTVTETIQYNYGICATTQILNFLADGEAVDNCVSPYHLAFNITGKLAYYVAGENINNIVPAIKITSAELLQQTETIPWQATGIMGARVADLYTFIKPAASITELGSNKFMARCVYATGETEDTTSDLATLFEITCDQVYLKSLTFENGGGVNLPAYYRGANIAGTNIRLQIALEKANTPVTGNTTVTLAAYNKDNGDNLLYTQDILFAAGQAEVVHNLPNPTIGGNANEIVDSQTSRVEYRISKITGGKYGDQQNAFARIDHSAVAANNRTIYWDANDYPGNHTNVANPFTTWNGFAQTPSSVTLKWQILSHAGPPYDGDFYTYRIYYRMLGATSWSMIDRSLADYAYLGNIASSQVIIKNLAALTTYEYYVTAVDYFGQEVLEGYNLYQDAPAMPLGAGKHYNRINTVASLIEVNLTDGITKYVNADFADNLAPLNRSLRESALVANITVEFSDVRPESVHLILAPLEADPVGAPVNMIVGGVLNPAFVEGTDYYRFEAIGKTQKKWRVTMPQSNPLIKFGQKLRFVLEIEKNGTIIYQDYNSATEPPPGDPNDYEWTFAINTMVTVTPWPVRILNNVITAENPVAYPTYYLTDDAFVTITVYDLKGRIVTVLLDQQERSKGQNIKERGWRAVNKAQGQVGPGLYYIQITAKRKSDQKIILNEFKKVVVAR